MTGSRDAGKAAARTMLAIVILTAVTPAAAQRPDGGDRPVPLAPPGSAVPRMDFQQFVVNRFIAADSNRDGRLTEAEIATLEVQRFNRLDGDRDGRIDPAEFTGPLPPGLDHARLAIWQARRRQQFEQLDGNRDGRIGVQEFTDSVRRSAATVDADGNGVISLQEFGESMRRIAVTQTSRGTDSAIARAFDSDRDGQVARTEMERGLEARFRTADRDGNGRISLAELFPRGDIGADAAARFADQDANRDNGLSLAEFASRWQHLFATLDRNQDHRLSPAELAAGRN